jgi:Phosphotransferase enzyme family
MPDASITILERESSAYVSTSFNEIVTCRLSDGSVRRLLLKRGVTHAALSFGHHGGVPYESEVYRSVLEPLNTSVPRFHSSYVDTETGETVLLIDYVENAMRLSKADRRFLYQAAGWIGTFHKLGESRALKLRDTVTYYDASYYAGWMQRALDFWAADDSFFLAELRGKWDALARELLASPPTVIHGEYYPKNILVHGSVISPIDWETAAIAAGEIDLACLTECWSIEDKERCIQAYVRARWPEGTPAGFPRRLTIAEMYLQLRWIGQGRHLVCKQEVDFRVCRLRELHEEIRLF